MFATLSAILHLGNMEINDDKDGNAALGNNKHFQVVEDPICVKDILGTEHSWLPHIWTDFDVRFL